MSEIKEQFVTYEIALKLKELGFDEPCFGYYTPMKYWMISTNPKYNSEPHYIGPNWCTEDMKMRFMFVTNIFGDRDSVVKNSEFTKAIHNVVVPLYSQVIDWCDSKGYYINVTRIFQWQPLPIKFLGWCIHIGTDNPEEELECNSYYISNFYPTKKEAINEAILKVIELKRIEISLY